jgi:hypothetical protein
MLDNSVLAGEILRHGAYVCLRLAEGADARHLAGVAIPALAEKLGLINEFAPAAGGPTQSIAFLRRHGATPGAIADDGVGHAEAVVHVAAPTAQPVGDFCAEATRLLGADAQLRVIGGVVRPRTYSGAAMNNFAYAHQVLQQPGRAMPNAFLLPMNKTAEWWAKDWMERHTYFLPRYDNDGRVKSEGHALAAAAGIPCLLRRTYKSTTEPAPEGAYDFVTYFEGADADVPTFHQVCANLRNVARNPEWKFVREGPMWQGRRSAWSPRASMPSRASPEFSEDLLGPDRL